MVALFWLWRSGNDGTVPFLRLVAFILTEELKTGEQIWKASFSARKTLLMFIPPRLSSPLRARPLGKMATAAGFLATVWIFESLGHAVIDVMHAKDYQSMPAKCLRNPFLTGYKVQFCRYSDKEHGRPRLTKHVLVERKEIRVLARTSRQAHQEKD